MPFVFFIAAALCLARFAVPPHEPLFSVVGSYQAVSHVFVGGLFGAAIADWRNAKWCLWLGLGMTTVEVFAAIGSRHLW